MKALLAILFAGMMGCAFAQPASAAGRAKYIEQVLYSFCGQKNCADGTGPTGGLISANGILYGTTYGGGQAGCDGGGCGTVFSINPNTDAETVVYSFCSKSECSDGQNPEGGVMYAKGKLYGTTFFGGANNKGTLFSLDPNSDKGKILYAFCSQQPNCADGSNPLGGPIYVNGVLYGTTETGGNANGLGTAYTVDPKTGTETVLYAFCSQKNCADGQNPTPTLTDVNGMLYGTTGGGGAYPCGNGQGCGTVFSLDPATGAETALHSFGNGTDGRVPQGGLIAANGVLYGTTYGGGIAGCGAFGCGTVYSIDPKTGVEKVLYTFCSKKNCADGQNPEAILIDVKGTIYGTTTGGGSGAGCGGSLGCGTVFSFDPNTGAESVLYSFCSQQNCADGENPTVGLIDVKGTLYGSTDTGGANGDGAVFALTKVH